MVAPIFQRWLMHAAWLRVTALLLSNQTNTERDLIAPVPAATAPKEAQLRPPEGPSVDNDRHATTSAIAWGRAGIGARQPAPTAPPRARPLDGDDVEQALEIAMRGLDMTGRSDREERLVSATIRAVFRAATVPDLTRARVEVSIGEHGVVTNCSVSRFSNGTIALWNAMAQDLCAALPTPLDLGPAARRAGVHLSVDASILHVYENGTDGSVMMGDCPPMPLVGGETPAPFGLPGGAAFGDSVAGTCALSDGPQQLKHIEVRTSSRASFPGHHPPPLVETIERAHPIPRPRILSLGELLVEAFRDP